MNMIALNFSSLLAAVNLQDLHAFDLNTLAWMDLGLSEGSPTPRSFHGFAASGGALFVFGGSNGE